MKLGPARVALVDVGAHAPTLDRIFLRVLTGAPTLTGCRAIAIDGAQVPKGSSDSFALSPTSEWQSLAQLLGSDWAAMEEAGICGVLPTVVGGTGAIEVRFGESAATGLVTLRAGDRFTAGRVPISNGQTPIERVGMGTWHASNNPWARAKATLSSGAAVKAFAGIAGFKPNPDRQFVNLVNLGSQPIYCRLVPLGQSANPTATDFDFSVPGGGDRQVAAGANLDVIVIQVSGGNQDYIAQELG